MSCESSDIGSKTSFKELSGYSCNSKKSFWHWKHLKTHKVSIIKIMADSPFEVHNSNK